MGRVDGEFDRVNDIVPVDSSLRGNAKQLLDSLICPLRFAISLRAECSGGTDLDVQQTADVLPECRGDATILIGVNRSGKSMEFYNVLDEILCRLLSCLELVGWHQVHKLCSAIRKH